MSALYISYYGDSIDLKRIIKLINFENDRFDQI